MTKAFNIVEFFILSKTDGVNIAHAFFKHKSNKTITLGYYSKLYL